MIPGVVLHGLLAVAGCTAAARALQAHRNGPVETARDNTRVAVTLAGLLVVDWARAANLPWALSVALYCGWATVLLCGSMRSVISQVCLAPCVWMCGWTTVLAMPSYRIHVYAVLHVIAGLRAWGWIVEAIAERRRAREAEIAFAMLAAHEAATLVALYTPREYWRLTSGLPALALYLSLTGIYLRWIWQSRSESRLRRSRPAGLPSSV